MPCMVVCVFDVYTVVVCMFGVYSILKTIRISIRQYAKIEEHRKKRCLNNGNMFSIPCKVRAVYSMCIGMSCVYSGYIR